jgi:hypothetical protein
VWGFALLGRRTCQPRCRCGGPPTLPMLFVDPDYSKGWERLCSPGYTQVSRSGAGLIRHCGPESPTNARSGSTWVLDINRLDVQPPSLPASASSSLNGCPWPAGRPGKCIP